MSNGIDCCHLGLFRGFLEDSLNSDDLKTLIFDHFHEIYQYYIESNINDNRIRLVEHCYSQGKLRLLVNKVREKNPHQYEIYKEKFGQMPDLIYRGPKEESVSHVMSNIQPHKIDLTEQVDRVVNIVSAAHPQGVYGFAVVDNNVLTNHRFLNIFCKRLIDDFPLQNYHRISTTIDKSCGYHRALRDICTLETIIQAKHILVIVDVVDIDKKEEILQFWQEISLKFNKPLNNGLFIFFILPPIGLPDGINEIQKPNYFQYNDVHYWIRNASKSLWQDDDLNSFNSKVDAWLNAIKKVCCKDENRYDIYDIYQHVQWINIQFQECYTEMRCPDRFRNKLEEWSGGL